MRVLVFNAGSSSLKFGVFEVGTETVQVLKGSYERFRNGQADMRIAASDTSETDVVPVASVEEALSQVPAALERFGFTTIDAVGHRVVHGGSRFSAATLIDDATIEEIEALVPLAPLHNPASLKAIRECRALWSDLPQVAVFDTAFHHTNPPFATTYAVPAHWREAGLRRYGFHGTSHKYVAERIAEVMGSRLSDLQIVSVHLGNGASACAINRGQSLDSSMGMTPLEGLVMGTRSGDIDPGAFGFLSRWFGLSTAEIESVLNNESGLKGLTGSSDMRDLEERAAHGDRDAQLAIEIYSYRTRKYIGSYAAAMGGLDAVVFTGGVGENSPSMRRRICDGLEFMGLHLDYDRNQSVDLSNRAAPEIQAYGSRVRVFVTETAEQLMIARETAAALARPEPVIEPIPVSVSARHVHLSREAVDILFGPGYELTPVSNLRQPGHWVAQERVTLEGPKGRIERVAILGPLRKHTQIEVSRTDSFALGIKVPVRDSGDLEGTPRVIIAGPQGRFETDGLILAARHIHINPQEAARLGLEDGGYIDVRVGDEHRGLVFARTLVRVGGNSVTEMHIDTDEANAAGIEMGAAGDIVPHQTATVHNIASDPA